MLRGGGGFGSPASQLKDGPPGVEAVRPEDKGTVLKSQETVRSFYIERLFDLKL
jgi:hypothetical protein